MAELKITAANFENEVLHSDKPVLLDFYADWCGPCKMLSPVLHELAEEKSGTLKVGKVNVDEQMELAMRFQVSSIPMLAVFKDGKAITKLVGYRLSRRLPQWWRAQDEVVIVGGVAGGASAAAASAVWMNTPDHHDRAQRLCVLCQLRSAVLCGRCDQGARRTDTANSGELLGPLSH